MTRRLPELEQRVLARVVRGEDPYGVWRGTSNSRIYSQALARLERKGLVEEKAAGAGGQHKATELGLRAHEENQ